MITTIKTISPRWRDACKRIPPRRQLSVMRFNYKRKSTRQIQGYPLQLVPVRHFKEGPFVRLEKGRLE